METERESRTETETEGDRDKERTEPEAGALVYEESEAQLRSSESCRVGGPLLRARRPVQQRFLLLPLPWMGSDLLRWQTCQDRIGLVGGP